MPLPPTWTASLIINSPFLSDAFVTSDEPTLTYHNHPNLIVHNKLTLVQSISSVQFSLVTQLCLTLCDPMNRSTPGLPVHQ